MIVFTQPYSIEKDFGKAYNDYMRLIPDDAWMCFTDLDTMFLTSDIGHQLEEIVKAYPDTGLFTCQTNRVGNLNQCYAGKINEDPNMLNHKRIATQLQREFRIDVKELTDVISGHLMLIKKSTWKEIGEFPEGRGILGIDNLISRKILASGKKIRLMLGVYLLHFYRLDVGKDNKSHLIISDPQSPQHTARRKKIARMS